ncbi:MAG: tRNA preQ1(34) S-adenosylmethionine ribosyltransferase-isomerase QueA [Kiloniellales bacterium]|nr:tRNA preQ1(34) S-adenosylmethionine ribosyltransferase-isomerase QueA [Kiloniellales bacterium]
MRTDDFDFALPPELIAQHPIAPRDAARLLVIGKILEDKEVRDLPDLLRPGDLLVVNDTRVLPTRLSGRRGAAKIEATLHKAEGPGLWRAFARPARKLRPGDEIVFAPDFTAAVRSKDEAGEVLLDFACGEAELLAGLQRHGAMPLPPYIKRDLDGHGPDPRDRDDYQTVFATKPGAVAAPTAGLHFTPELLARLEARGIARVTLTLHVGAGTFLPVKSEDPRDHVMHSEVGVITAGAARRINEAREAGGRIVAVGSTALRLLESACGDDGRIAAFAGETALYLLPGDPIRAADLMLTNFHLPRSTLFMLVCAFAGQDRMKSAYAHAIAARYRFFSYGDACLIYGKGVS